MKNNICNCPFKNNFNANTTPNGKKNNLKNCACNQTNSIVKELKESFKNKIDFCARNYYPNFNCSSKNISLRNLPFSLSKNEDVKHRCNDENKLLTSKQNNNEIFKLLCKRIENKLNFRKLSKSNCNNITRKTSEFNCDCKIRDLSNHNTKNNDKPCDINDKHNGNKRTFKVEGNYSVEKASNDEESSSTSFRYEEKKENGFANNRKERFKIHANEQVHHKNNLNIFEKTKIEEDNNYDCFNVKKCKDDIEKKLVNQRGKINKQKYEEQEQKIEENKKKLLHDEKDLRETDSDNNVYSIRISKKTKSKESSGVEKETEYISDEFEKSKIYKCYSNERNNFDKNKYHTNESIRNCHKKQRKTENRHKSFRENVELGYSEESNRKSGSIEESVKWPRNINIKEKILKNDNMKQSRRKKLGEENEEYLEVTVSFDENSIKPEGYKKHKRKIHAFSEEKDLKSSFHWEMNSKQTDNDKDLLKNERSVNQLNTKNVSCKCKQKQIMEHKNTCKNKRKIRGTHYSNNKKSMDMPKRFEIQFVRREPKLLRNCRIRSNSNTRKNISKCSFGPIKHKIHIQCNSKTDTSIGTLERSMGDGIVRKVSFEDVDKQDRSRFRTVKSFGSSDMETYFTESYINQTNECYDDCDISFKDITNGIKILGKHFYSKIKNIIGNINENKFEISDYNTTKEQRNNNIVNRVKEINSRFEQMNKSDKSCENYCWKCNCYEQNRKRSYSKTCDNDQNCQNRIKGTNDRRKKNLTHQNFNVDISSKQIYHYNNKENHRDVCNQTKECKPTKKCNQTEKCKDKRREQDENSPNGDFQKMLKSQQQIGKAIELDLNLFESSVEGAKDLGKMRTFICLNTPSGSGDEHKKRRQHSEIMDSYNDDPVEYCNKKLSTKCRKLLKYKSKAVPYKINKEKNNKRN